MITIHQDLGPGSQSCNLDTRGLALACAAAERASAGGAELVVLSHFGGQEAEHGGLLAAFQANDEDSIPFTSSQRLQWQMNHTIDPRWCLHIDR